MTELKRLGVAGNHGRGCAPTGSGRTAALGAETP